MFGEITSQPPFCAFFFGSVCFGTPVKTCQSSSYLASLQNLGVPRKNQWRKSLVEREVMYLVHHPLYEVPWEPTTLIFWLLWLPIFWGLKKPPCFHGFGETKGERKGSKWQYRVGSHPPRTKDAIVANQVLLLSGIPDPKNVYWHPGGDWNSGWGLNPKYEQPHFV